MSCQVKTRPGMSRDMQVADVLGAVEHAAQINTAWTLARFGRGLTAKDDTPCCAGCAGAQYVDPGKNRSEVTTADIVCRTRRADCKAAAAMSIGYERAVAIHFHNMSPIEARSRWYAMFEPSSTDPDYGHVVVMTPEGRDDPTEEMLEENGRAA